MSAFEKVFDHHNRRVRGLWSRSGRFYCQIRRQDKRSTIRVQLVAATVPQAVRAMQVVRSQKAVGAFEKGKQADTAPLTVGSAIDRYVEHLKAMDSKTTKSRKREEVALKNWKDFAGDIPLAGVDRPLFFRYAANRKKHITRTKQAVSGRCVDLEVSCMMNLLRHYHDHGPLTGKLFALEWKPLAKPSAPKRLITAEEIDAVCRSAIEHQEYGQQFADYVRLLQLTGAREQEGMLCKWSGVDWRNNLLTIFQTKNGEPPRHVAIHPALATHLREMQTRRSESDWLFPSSKFSDDKPSRNMHNALYKAMRDAGVKDDKRWAFHHLRHHFCSWAVMSGVDFMTIAEWVGHKDRGVLICKVYGHLDPKHKQNAAKQLKFAA